MLVANGPNVADWISTIGQAVGALGTLAAVAVALWLAKRDNNRLIAERRDRDISQARLISAAVQRDVGVLYLEVRNDSPGSIYDLTVQDDQLVSQGYRVTHSLVEEQNGRFIRTRKVANGPHTLPPGSSLKLAIERSDTSTAPEEVDRIPPPTLDFTDSAGLRWNRRGPSAPQRVLGN